MSGLPEAFALVSAVVARAAEPAGPPPDRSELVAALAALRELREELASWEPALIAAARSAGVSWADLAPALGVSSRQAAERRFLRLQPSGDQDRRTGEERVRDERDRRAGDRAVGEWARRAAPAGRPDRCARGPAGRGAAPGRRRPGRARRRRRVRAGPPPGRSRIPPRPHHVPARRAGEERHRPGRRGTPRRTQSANRRHRSVAGWKDGTGAGVVTLAGVDRRGPSGWVGAP